MYLSILRRKLGQRAVLCCVRLGGFVACVHDFMDHPKVMNGASDLIVSILGEFGRHARCTVGVASLPLGAAVEVDAVFRLRL
jgi:enamine deaminase RidA (YjgF/YER057c/UK114 family)